MSRKRSMLLTHRGSTRGLNGRSRVFLRDCGRWWTSRSGLRFSKENGICRTHDVRLLLDTVEEIEKPHGIYEEIMPADGGQQRVNPKEREILP